MNTVFRQFTAVLGLTAALGLVSCQDKTLSPGTPNVATGLARLTSAGSGQTLSKHGQATLTYQSDGRLQQATYAPGPVVYPANTVLYSYGPQSITARSYKGSALVGVVTFLTDNTGRCTESRHAWYGNRTPVETAWTYTYNTLGQLVARVSKNSRVNIQYTFDGAGDLSRAVIFDATGAASKAINFTYSLHNPPAYHNPPDDRPTDTPLLTDRSPLNADFSNLFYGYPPDPFQPNTLPPDPYLPNTVPPDPCQPNAIPPDPYLPIFGFSSNHLVQMITLNDIATNRVERAGYFFYSFDTNGYVTQAREFNGATNALIATRLYGYLVPAVLVAK